MGGRRQGRETSGLSRETSGLSGDVATQLPSSRALPTGVVIWYIDLLETPSLTQGTLTPQTHAHDGRTQSNPADVREGSAQDGKSAGARG